MRRLFGVAEVPKSLWLVEGATHSGIRSPVLDQLAPDVISFLATAWQSQDKLAEGSVSALRHVPEIQ
jgi:hypothetical protein